MGGHARDSSVNGAETGVRIMDHPLRTGLRRISLLWLLASHPCGREFGPRAETLAARRSSKLSVFGQPDA
jgi:hypothetical protein